MGPGHPAQGRQQQMSQQQMFSLKLGVGVWIKFELPLVDGQVAQVDIDLADEILSPPVLPTQMAPKNSGQS